jgi:hypothetical protein
MPTREQWLNRNIMAELQSMARRGPIAVEPVSEDIAELTGHPDSPAGWKAYGFRVPAGEKLHVRLRHSNEGWFRLMMVDRWGEVGKGMLQNLIPTGNPEVSFTNLTQEAQSVYVIVDDPGLWSSSRDPFSMKVDRSWNPASKKLDGAPIGAGIWAQKQEAARLTPPAVKAPSDPMKS